MGYFVAVCQVKKLVGSIRLVCKVLVLRGCFEGPLVHAFVLCWGLDNDDDDDQWGVCVFVWPGELVELRVDNWAGLLLSAADKYVRLWCHF